MTPRAPRPTLQPRVSLGVIYVMAFFFLYCLALAGPSLYEVLVTLPPGPAQEAMAKQVARDTVQGRLGLALVAAVVTVAAAAWANLLPGMRRR